MSDDNWLDFMDYYDPNEKVDLANAGGLIGLLYRKWKNTPKNDDDDDDYDEDDE